MIYRGLTIGLVTLLATSGYGLSFGFARLRAPAVSRKFKAEQRRLTGSKVMQGIYYAIFVVSVLVVIRWYIRNERSGPDGTKGWFAMRSRRTPNKFVAPSAGQQRDQKPGVGNAARLPRKTT